MISVCILTKNSQHSLKETLESVQSFNEVLVLDTGSTDQTIPIAQSFPNVVVFETPFTGFGILRNKVANLAKNDWILALDSDEIISNELREEIASITLDPNNIYEIPFHNFYNGKRIMGCGWHPESHIRLYHRKNATFSEAFLHEGVISISSRIIRLKYPIHHTPYRSTSDFLNKMQLYSNLFANERSGKQASSFWKALIHGFGAFFRSYVLKRGFLIGKEGFIISIYNANVAFYKYLKLAEANRKL